MSTDREDENKTFRTHPRNLKASAIAKFSVFSNPKTPLSSKKTRVITHGKGKSSTKTDRYLALADNILTLNRRIISITQIETELKREFEDAQKHLDECPSERTKWLHANADDCQQHYTSEGLNSVGIAHMRGIRPTMEDTHIATTLLLYYHEKVHQVRLYGIFDGHGGDACAKYLAKNLPSYLKTKLENALGKCSSKRAENAAIFNTLKLTFVELGAEYRKSALVNGGSTANIVLIFKKTLWTANVGDTRSILVLNDKAIALSEDAKPALEKYKRGVEKRQCVVLEVNGIARVEGILAIARAVGHKEIASGVSPRSKVTKYSFQYSPKGRNYLVIACDGLWDVASSNQVALTVQQLSGNTPEQIAVHLIKKAFEAESTDNISALVAIL